MPKPIKATSLVFSQTAWCKLLVWTKLGHTEMTCWGISSADDPLFIEDIRMVRHYATTVGVEMDDIELALYTQDLLEQEGVLADNSRRIWIHTHPGDSPEPTHTDEKSFDELSAKVDWAVMMILSRGNKYYARLRVSTSVRLHEQSGQGQIYTDTRLDVDIQKWGGHNRKYTTLAEFEPEWYYEYVESGGKVGMDFQGWIKEWHEKCRPMKEQPEDQRQTKYYSGYHGGGSSWPGFQGQIQGQTQGSETPASGTAGYPATKKEAAVTARDLQFVNPMPDLPPTAAALLEYITDALLCVAHPDEKVRLEHWLDLLEYFEDPQDALAWWRWAEKRHLIEEHHQPIRVPKKGQLPRTNNFGDWPGPGKACGGWTLAEVFVSATANNQALYNFYKMASRYQLTHGDLGRLMEMKKTRFTDFTDELLALEYDMNDEGWPCLLNEAGLKAAEEVVLARRAAIKEAVAANSGANTPLVPESPQVHQGTIADFMGDGGFD